MYSISFSPFFPLQALCVVVLIMARTGFSENTNKETLYQNADHRWLTITTTGGFTIILGTMILTYLLGDAIADRMVS